MTSCSPGQSFLASRECSRCSKATIQSVEVLPMTLTKKLILCGLLIGVAAYSMPNHAHADESAQVVKITASKFHFTPDHITFVKGQPVTLQLSSTDRAHGFL